MVYCKKKMHFIEYLNLKTLKYDLNNKFFYKNTKKIPKIKKIILRFKCKTTDTKQLASTLLALNLITSKVGKLTTARKDNIILKIRKGEPTGCKLTLQKRAMFIFLEKLVSNIFPNIKNFNGIITNNKILNTKSFSYELYQTFTFSELETHYQLFNNLPRLNITFLTNAENKKELIFLLKSLQFPVKFEN